MGFNAKFLFSDENPEWRHWHADVIEDKKLYYS